LGAHRARVHHRVGPGPERGPLGPAALQRTVRDPSQL